MAALSEITGYFVKEFQRWDSTAMIVIDIPGELEGVSGDITVKVECDPDELKPDLEYRFVGQWKNHPKYGRQFHASSFVLCQPHGRTGIIAYLVRTAEGLRFGPARAAAVWEAFGSQAVEVAREQPGKVVEACQAARLQIDHSAAVNLAARLRDGARLESCTLTLLDLLTCRGFPRGVVRECIREWGAKAADMIRRDPFKLMRFSGCGFKRCDAMWMELGLPAARLKRQSLAGWYAIKQDTDGHTWYPATVAEFGVRSNIGGAEVKPEKAMLLAVRGGLLEKVTTQGAQGPVASNGSGTVAWVAERRNAENERRVAEEVVRAMGEGVGWPRA
jgi:hypothetical protein